MIRRSPTRIELKLDDLQDFDYISKAEKKKTPSAGVTVQEAQKLMRHERIGFRPLRSSSSGIPAVVFASGAEATAALINYHSGGATIPANGVVNEGGNVSPSTATSSTPTTSNGAGNPVQQINTVTPAAAIETEPEANSTTPSTAEVGATSAVDMSMSFDE